MTRARVALIAVLIAAIVAALAVVMLPRVLNSPPGAGDWQAQFAACAPSPLTPEIAFSEPMRECVQEVLVAAVEAGELAAVQDGLRAQIEADPLMFDVCHQPGHRAGEYAFERSGDVVALIGSAAQETCQFAVGHGILDGFGLSNPDEEAFVAAAEACLAIDEETAYVSRTLCLDGMGHAAWTSTGDFRAAVGRCALVPDDFGQGMCTEGVLMQIFEPASLEPVLPLTTAPAVIPGLCGSAGAVDVDIIEGCYRGAGYIFSRGQQAAGSDWEQANPPGARISEADAQVLLDAMVASADWCALLGPGEHSCMGIVASMTPRPLFSRPVLLREGCSLHADPEWYERCVSPRRVF